jgi:hypothetical protein
VIASSTRREASMGLEIIGGVTIGIVAAVASFIWIAKKNPPPR